MTIFREIKNVPKLGWQNCLSFRLFLVATKLSEIQLLERNFEKKHYTTLFYNLKSKTDLEKKTRVARKIQCGLPSSSLTFFIRQLAATDLSLSLINLTKPEFVSTEVSMNTVSFPSWTSIIVKVVLRSPSSQSIGEVDTLDNKTLRIPKEEVLPWFRFSRSSTNGYGFLKSKKGRVLSLTAVQPK